MVGSSTGGGAKQWLAGRPDSDELVANLKPMSTTGPWANSCECYLGQRWSEATWPHVAAAMVAGGEEDGVDGLCGGRLWTGKDVGGRGGQGEEMGGENRVKASDWRRILPANEKRTRTMGSCKRDELRRGRGFYVRVTALGIIGSCMDSSMLSSRDGNAWRAGYRLSSEQPSRPFSLFPPFLFQTVTLRPQFLSNIHSNSSWSKHETWT